MPDERMLRQAETLRAEIWDEIRPREERVAGRGCLSDDPLSPGEKERLDEWESRAKVVLDLAYPEPDLVGVEERSEGYYDERLCALNAALCQFLGIDP